MSIDGKVALVTGASRGIGAAIADGLGAQGAVVIGTATTDAGAQRIDERLKAAGIKGAGRCLNVTEAGAAEALIKDIVAEFGAIQILVNNAGITRDNLMMRMKDTEWNEVVDTNLNAIFRVSKACLRGMMKARWGRIINISSVVGSMGNPGQANYSATKAGVEGFSRSLASEVGSRGITVNSVAPGFISTDMTAELSSEQKDAMLSRVPAGRLGQPEEIAALVVFLAGEPAGYITGETIQINGGMYMS
ncbi:MAG: 3-oxoacyl-ACP reductase FabG [Pseudomonadales bacterium]